MGLASVMPTSVAVSVVLIQEDDGWWSAQCLEYDIAAQAKNLTDLYYELEKTLVAHVAVHEAEGIVPFECLEAAPPEYWNMFHNAKLQVVGTRHPFRAPSALQHPIPVPNFRVAERHI